MEIRTHLADTALQSLFTFCKINVDPQLDAEPYAEGLTSERDNWDDAVVFQILGTDALRLDLGFGTAMISYYLLKYAFMLRLDLGFGTAMIGAGALGDCKELRLDLGFGTAMMIPARDLTRHVLRLDLGFGTAMINLENRVRTLELRLDLGFGTAMIASRDGHSPMSCGWTSVSEQLG